MEAWAAAKRVRTPLHGLSPAQPGPGRTGLEVPTGVLAGGSPRPQPSRWARWSPPTPGLELRRWLKLLPVRPA